MREWMWQARKNRNLTIKEVSEKLGISESYYSMIERGERQRALDVSFAYKLANIFDLSLDNIVKMECDEVHTISGREMHSVSCT